MGSRALLFCAPVGFSHVKSSGTMYANQTKFARLTHEGISTPLNFPDVLGTVPVCSHIFSYLIFTTALRGKEATISSILEKRLRFVELVPSRFT